MGKADVCIGVLGLWSFGRFFCKKLPGSSRTDALLAKVETISDDGILWDIGFLLSPDGAGGCLKEVGTLWEACGGAGSWQDLSVERGATLEQVYW